LVKPVIAHQLGWVKKFINKKRKVNDHEKNKKKKNKTKTKDQINVGYAKYTQARDRFCRDLANCCGGFLKCLKCC